MSLRRTLYITVCTDSLSLFLQIKEIGCMWKRIVIVREQRLKIYNLDKLLSVNLKNNILLEDFNMFYRHMLEQ